MIDKLQYCGYYDYQIMNFLRNPALKRGTGREVLGIRNVLTVRMVVDLG